MSQQAAARAEAALRDRLTHLAYLDEVLSAELDDRKARRRERRIHEARLPRLRLIADFDLEAAHTLDPALLGDRGTGKSHLLIGLGMAACQRGLRVRYTTAAALVNELAEAAHERLLSRVVACSRAWSPATAGSTRSASTSSATSPSTRAEPNCPSRSSPSVRSGRPWRATRTPGTTQEAPLEDCEAADVANLDRVGQLGASYRRLP